MNSFSGLDLIHQGLDLGSPLLNWAVIIGTVVLALAARGIMAIQRRNAWRRLLTPVADRLGLTVYTSPTGAVYAAGELDDIPVTVRLEPQPPGPDGPRPGEVRVEARPPFLPRDVILAAEGRRTGFARLVAGQDRQTGDADFDDRVVVGGTPSWVRATLDEPTRDAVQVAVAAGLWVEDGAVWAQSARAARDALFLRRLIERVVALGTQLRPTDQRERLLHAVRTEPAEAVVAGALESLLDGYSLGDGETAELLNHPQAHVRLAVAKRLGARGWAAVEALVLDDAVHLPVRTEALAQLRRIRLHRAAPVAQAIVAGPWRSELTLAALDLLAAAGECPPLAMVAENIEIRSPALRLALARCLVHSREPVEAYLLELLADPDDEVATAAAFALATQGTRAAIVPLQARIRLERNAALRQAVANAVAALQAGAEGTAGGLSLANPGSPAGGLTLPEDP